MQTPLIQTTASESILQSLLTCLRFSVLMLVLCGVIYSGAVTLLAEQLFPRQASGSLVQQNGNAIGSELIAQPFTGDQYFHGRPSAANHDPMATAGSNLAPSNPALRERVSADSARIQAQENVEAKAIPVDLLAASGGGLDPHISPASAHLQAARIAQARQLSIEKITALIDHHTEGPQWAVFGQPRVNVLLLNLALDAATAQPRSHHDRFQPKKSDDD